MPILAKQIDVYPPGLLEAEDRDDASARWWVVRTRPRQEKALARQLRAKQVPFCLPQIQKTWRNNGRTLTTYLPAFTGYVFIRVDEEQRYQTLATNRVARLLPVYDQRRLRGELRRVKQLVDSGLPLYPERRLAPGRRVRIVGGPLSGLVGVILQRKGSCRFVVAVDLIQQGVAAEVSADVIEPLGP